MPSVVAGHNLSARPGFDVNKTTLHRAAAAHPRIADILAEAFHMDHVIPAGSAGS
jgi:hypothetical protein